MNSAELVHAGRLEEGILALQSEIRAKPEDTRLRVFLFQLNCVMGRWDKALNQLQVIASLNAETMLLAQIFRPVIACELFRRAVFQGKHSPLIFGEPAEWIGLLVQSNSMVATGNPAAAAELRERAFEAAPVSSGKVDGRSFEWVADGDCRLGPMMEVILEGKYYWIPFNRISRIELEKPSDLRDLVWTPARFTWTNGGAVSAHIPVRYPGTEDSADAALRLARKTDWHEISPNSFIGLGQRVITTDSGEDALLECREIELTKLT